MVEVKGHAGIWTNPSGKKAICKECGAEFIMKRQESIFCGKRCNDNHSGREYRKRKKESDEKYMNILLKKMKDARN